MSPKVYLCVFVKAFKVQKLGSPMGTGEVTLGKLFILSDPQFTYPDQTVLQGTLQCEASNFLWTGPTEPPSVVKWESPRHWEQRGNWSGEGSPD